MRHGALTIMLPAFVECLLLVAILSYLGLHVIKRKVIFVDLALAQIAALGATVGFLFGMDPASTAAFVFSMAFSFIGAAVFALTRFRGDRVPQEAIIGLVYALAAAMAILVIDKSPHGAEHIKDLLTGTILWVKWPEIIGSAVAFGLAGLFHYIFRHQFIRITEDPDGAFEAKMWVRLWDFLFYLSFGFVITFAVRTAGVLLVFVFLVAPTISAVMLTHRWRSQLLVGWGLGVGVTGVALYLSFALDLPSGPAVVTFYGVVLLLVALLVFVIKAPNRGRAARRLGLGVAGVTLVAGGLWALGTALGASRWAGDHEHEQVPHIHDEMTSDAHQRPHAHHDHHLAEAASDTQKHDEHGDPQARLAALKKRVAAVAPGWKRDLVQTVVHPDLPLLFKEEALGLLRKHAGQDFGYDPEKADNAEARRKMRAWAAGRREP